MSLAIDYDVDIGRKLLKSLDSLENVKAIKVRKPNSKSLEDIDLSMYMKWLWEYLDAYGDVGIAQHIDYLFRRIEASVKQRTVRAKEGMRMLLQVIDKFTLEIKRLEDEIVVMQAKIDEKDRVIQGFITGEAVVPESQVQEERKPVEEQSLDEEQPEVKPRKKGLKMPE